MQVLSYYRQAHKAATTVIEKRSEYYKALAIFKKKCDEYLSFHEAAPVTAEWRDWLDKWFNEATSADVHLKEQSEEMEKKQEEFQASLEEFEKKYGNIGSILSSTTPSSLSEAEGGRREREKEREREREELLKSGESIRADFDEQLWIQWRALGVDMTQYYQDALKFEESKAEYASVQERRFWMREISHRFELLKDLHERDKAEYTKRYNKLKNYQNDVTIFIEKLDKMSETSRSQYDEYLKMMLDSTNQN
eukprot:CAMPEP_0201503398 /NCGR_PEP_ID=MMETSP0151_2-20130828/84641_1 /ASSEMBLY_ACC=CAM_ASM_000257 /TAXON_ID=200890 /ORGANISM="Paramoeba atlantica, Strain 621/1 / CCAP 1560/9" /LENGTH=250 /DNA_ID=CAMNT_0047897047 /DNA_START=613 /DNA_END=1366 /DNA_ORIENTATION=-